MRTCRNPRSAQTLSQDTSSMILVWLEQRSLYEESLQKMSDSGRCFSHLIIIIFTQVPDGLDMRCGRRDPFPFMDRDRGLQDKLQVTTSAY